MLVFLVVVNRHVYGSSRLIDRYPHRERFGAGQHSAGFAPGQVNSEGRRQDTAAAGCGKLQAGAFGNLGRTQGYRHRWRQFQRLGEDPRPGLLDGQPVLCGNLELNLNGVVIPILNPIKRFEMVMDGFEVAAQLTHLGVGHQELVCRRQVGAGQHGGGAGGVQQQLLGLGVSLGIGHQVLAHLRVDVVGILLEGDGVIADRDAVDRLVGVVGVHEDAHEHGGVVNPVEVAFQKGAVIPQAGPDALDGLVDAVFGGLVRILGLGTVQSGAIEGRQVFIVRAGSVA